MSTYHFNLASYFKEIVSKFSSNTALKYLDSKYTYSQIDKDSSKLALFLKERKVKKGDLIAISNSKNYLSYILMIACLKIGAIYTNIDPEAPVSWIEDLLKTYQPKLIFFDSDHQPYNNNSFFTKNMIIGCKHIENYLLNFCKSPPEFREKINGDSIVYLMFTSGSTGKPKGVAITHQNLIHFINWSINRFQICQSDTISNVNPMYFDNSVFDFYSALFSGASLAPIKKEILKTPKDLVEQIDALECTIWFSVPSLLIYITTNKVLNISCFKKLKTIVFGGEAYPKAELFKLYNLFKNSIRFVSVYGPTECTCICSSYEVSDSDFDDQTNFLPLGEINQNIDFIILDENSTPATKGELCLIGPNVSSGYYKNPELTSKSFIKYSQKNFLNTNLYKTGDLVFSKNNLLFFLGRKDRQIKHMGYRIELDGIECLINKLEDVNETAVIYKRVSKSYGKIIALIGTQNKSLNSKIILSELNKSMPNYLIPNQFEFFEFLPKNPNGKIDRKFLAEQYDLDHKFASLKN